MGSAGHHAWSRPAQGAACGRGGFGLRVVEACTREVGIAGCRSGCAQNDPYSNHRDSKLSPCWVARVDGRLDTVAFATTRGPDTGGSSVTLAYS